MYSRAACRGSAPLGLTQGAREPQEQDRAALDYCQSRLCRQVQGLLPMSLACCLLVENSTCPLPTSDLNLWGSTQVPSSPSCTSVPAPDISPAASVPLTAAAAAAGPSTAIELGPAGCPVLPVVRATPSLAICSQAQQCWQVRLAVEKAWAMALSRVSPLCGLTGCQVCPDDRSLPNCNCPELPTLPNQGKPTARLLPAPQGNLPVPQSRLQGPGSFGRCLLPAPHSAAAAGALPTEPA